MTKVSLLFCLLTILLFAGCKEAKPESVQTATPIEQSAQEISQVKSLYDNPPLVGDSIEACDLCTDPSAIIVHRAPFNTSKAYYKDIIIDSGAALSLKEFMQAELLQAKFIGGLYQRYLEQMQSEKGDSAYFSGNIMFKLDINKNGSVDKVEIISSTTNFSKFDNEIKDSVQLWTFPQKTGPSVISFPLKFVKTKYPRGFTEISNISI